MGAPWSAENVEKNLSEARRETRRMGLTVEKLRRTEESALKRARAAAARSDDPALQSACREVETTRRKLKVVMGVQDQAQSALDSAMIASHLNQFDRIKKLVVKSLKVPLQDDYSLARAQAQVETAADQMDMTEDGDVDGGAATLAEDLRAEAMMTRLPSVVAGPLRLAPAVLSEDRLIDHD